jgi:hypothetical protein
MVPTETYQGFRVGTALKRGASALRIVGWVIASPFAVYLASFSAGIFF